MSISLWVHFSVLNGSKRVFKCKGTLPLTLDFNIVLDSLPLRKRCRDPHIFTVQDSRCSQDVVRLTCC